ncbi:uncharacterized protein LOC106754821 [Vigna radiata var. radiata]|uniref:Uncharacterized protein LOC106754821 n=1 Tax=Vigna radiata var. radiata TaxID=3916 RepID=A0A1S3TF40_VIGRR|nr:uncharacterized protein LOC106754821 [Vigna radiata var. radiata]
METFKKLEITIPFSEAIQQIPSYSKFLKEIITKKRKYAEKETIEVEGNCSAIIQRSLPPKSSDPGSFTIPCAIGELEVGKALIDLGASINLMPLTMFKKLKGVELKQTRIVLQLVDRSLKYLFRIVEDVIVKVDKFLFPVDFVVMEMEENGDAPLILGRPFMKTARIVIDMDLVEEICMNQESRVRNVSMLDRILTNECENLNEEEDISHQKCIQELEASKEVSPEKVPFEQIDCTEKTSDSKIELKELPSHLKYVFLEDHEKKPIIISASLSQEEERKLVGTLRKNKGAIGWSITDLKGISLTYCMHRILVEDDYKPVAQPQRRLNPVMKEVVRKEVLKLIQSNSGRP